MIYCIGSRCRRVAVLNRKVSTDTDRQTWTLELNASYSKSGFPLCKCEIQLIGMQICGAHLVRLARLS
jgi:hypothetical protein